MLIDHLHTNMQMHIQMLRHMCLDPHKHWQLCKHTKHTFYKLISHTDCTAGRLADSLGRYQAFDGVLGSSTLVGQMCVCVFVVKSTLATVCLSISPVWHRWKELLFRGQPHPTLINRAARVGGRNGWGAEVERDRGGREGTHPNQQRSTLFFVLTPVFVFISFPQTNQFPLFISFFSFFLPSPCVISVIKSELGSMQTCIHKKHRDTLAKQWHSPFLQH